jgi:hypothetical protein
MLRPLKAAGRAGGWLEAVLGIILFVSGTLFWLVGLGWLAVLEETMAVAPEAYACASAQTLAETEVRWLPYCAVARIHAVIAWFGSWNPNTPPISREATVGEVWNILMTGLIILFVLGMAFGLAALWFAIWAPFSHLMARRLLDKLGF